MDAEQFKALIAAYHIDRSHVLYLRTKNPVHAWSAYRTARTLGVPVPAWVLDCLDAWATVLTTETHTSAKAIADALQIGKKGGATVTKKAAREVRDLQIVTDILDRMRHLPLDDSVKAYAKTRGIRIPRDVDPKDRRLTTIMEEVAGQYGVEYVSVRAIYYRMIRSAHL